MRRSSMVSRDGDDVGFDEAVAALGDPVSCNPTSERRATCWTSSKLPSEKQSQSESVRAENTSFWKC